MAIQLPIAVYGNGDLYRELFNAIAATTGNNAYGILLHFAILATGTWAIVRYSVERSLMPLLRWLLLYYAAFYVIFLPKATIEIIDMVNAGKAYTVDNVPLGLAIVASYTSSIGAGLTELTEENFSLPDDLFYAKTGMVMASRLVVASTQFEVTDPNFAQSLQSFTHQCIFYDLLLNKYSWNDLLNATNIWQLVTANASPARAFVYYEPGGNSQVMTCQAGAAKLTSDWKTAVNEAAARYGARLFPDANDAKTQLLSYLPTSYGFLTNLSDDAASLMQQNMMANALQNGILQMGTTTNSPAALEAYAFTKAQQQKRLTNYTVGDMAAYWLPLMKNVLEATLYAAFIFIFLLLLFPFGQSIFKNYVASLLWLQMWAPLYAILNLFMNFYAQKHSIGAINLGSNNPGTGLTLSTQAGLAQVNSDITGLAGYLSLSVPLIAAGLVKGMMGVFTQAAQYIAGVTQGAASSAASEAMGGNLSLGNTNFSNHSSYNTSANHFDTNARVFSGMITTQMPSGSTLSLNPDGSTVLNNQGAISSLATSVNLSKSIREMASQQSDSSYTAALNHANAYSQSMTSGLRDLYDLGSHVATNESSGSGSTMSVSGSTQSALNNIHQLTDKFAHDHNLSHAKALQLLGSVSASGQARMPGTAMGSPLDASLGGKLEGSGSLSHENRQLYSAAEDFVRNTNFSESLNQAITGVKEHSFRASDETGQRLAQSASSSFDQANQARQEAMASYQESQSYRQVASYAEENAQSINSNATQGFMNWMEHQQGMHPSDIDKMMVNEPIKAQALAEQYTHEQAQQYLQSFQSKGNASASNIQADFAHDNHQVAGNAAVSADYNANHARIATQAEKEGLASDHVVSKQAVTDAQQVIDGNQSGLITGKTDLENKGATLTGQVKDKVD